jgi:hypothetical protein
MQFELFDDINPLAARSFRFEPAALPSTHTQASQPCLSLALVNTHTTPLYLC